jgi:hypothetical protein
MVTLNGAPNYKCPTIVSECLENLKVLFTTHIPQSLQFLAFEIDGDIGIRTQDCKS